MDESNPLQTIQLNNIMTIKRLWNPLPDWDQQDLINYENYEEHRSLIDSINDYEHMALYADEHTLEHFERDLMYLQRPFIQQGQLFYLIFSNHLYKEKGYNSFRTYCEKVHGLQYWQVKRLVDTSRIATYLMSREFKIIPKNKYQCEILMWLENPLVQDDIHPEGYDRIFKVWSIVNETYPEHKITGKVIENIIRLEYPEFVPPRMKRKVTLNVETAELLHQTASNEGVDKDALIREMLNDRDHEHNDIDDEFKYDYDHQEMLEETKLLDRFYQACNVMGVKVNQVLDIVVNLLQEGNNLVEIFSTA